MGNVFVKILRLDPHSSLKRRTRLIRRKNAFWGANGAVASTPLSKEKVNTDMSPYRDDPSGRQQEGAAGRRPIHSGHSGQAYEDDADNNRQQRASNRTKSNEKGTESSSSNSVGRMVPVQEKNLFEFDDDISPASATTGSTFGSAVGVSEGLASISIESTPTSGLSRGELAARREAVVQEKVKEALEFKQELDEAQRREAQDLEEAKAKYDSALNVWATNNKEKRNVRTLLTSMHNVLWPDSGWKPLGLGDVIESKKVKLHYRKAMLVVHPDRCSALTAEIRFIAKRIFEAINEAYQEFLKKEGV